MSYYAGHTWFFTPFLSLLALGGFLISHTFFSSVASSLIFPKKLYLAHAVSPQ